MPVNDSPRAPLPSATTSRRGRVLCVDDEPNILEGLRRHVGRSHDLVLARTAEEALALLVAGPPFDAVVSDMRMPGMDGATFLARVREQAPDTVRILLTGQADSHSAAAAVNEGRIHRLLTKPCSSQVILAAIESGIEEQRERQAERELADRTRAATVQLLIDVTGALSPCTSGRAARFRGYVKHMCELLGLANSWEHEVAASLSQVGCIALSPDLLMRGESFDPLREDELRQIRSHAVVGAHWIASIPRLERVAAMVEHQYATWEELTARSEPLDETVALGAQMLRLAREIDVVVVLNPDTTPTFGGLRRLAGGVHPRLLEIVDRIQPKLAARLERSMTLRDLGAGMVLEQDVRTLAGLLVVPRGQEVTPSVIQRLSNFSKSVGIAEPILVTVIAAR